MRLFIAINLPARERAKLVRAAAPLRDAGLPVRWSEPDAIHLTLKFLGWVRPEDVVRAQRLMAVAAGKTAPFALSVGGFGAFPTVRRPRVIWAGAEATPPLRCLKHDLEWEFARLGFEREVRAFQPHVTLGRVTSTAKAGDFRAFEELVSGLSYRSEVEVRKVDLMRSHLSPNGARYERIASASLGVATAVDETGRG